MLIFLLIVLAVLAINCYVVMLCITAKDADEAIEQMWAERRAEQC